MTDLVTMPSWLFVVVLILAAIGMVAVSVTAFDAVARVHIPRRRRSASPPSRLTDYRASHDRRFGA